MKLNFKETDELIKILKSDFQKELLYASLYNLNDINNKLRFNNFAYSIRELSRHILHTLSPDQDVLNCSWYKNETQKTNGISRGQRIKYAIQGGLEDEFVDRELIEISKINNLKKKVNNSINLLSKYTHINQKTFDITEIEVARLSSEIMKHLIEFAKTILKSRQLIISQIEEKINNEFIEHSISETINEIDILATHHNIEDISVDDTEITKIESDKIIFYAQGFIDVRLQWGSNSDLRNDIGAEMYDSFPYDSILEVTIIESFENTDVIINSFNVNTDGWYE